MKISKVYWKMFLGFMAVLLVTEVLIFGLFLGTVGRTFRDRYLQYAEATMVVARELVESNLAAAGPSPEARRDSLHQSLVMLAKTYGVKIWISSPTGSKVLAKSFEGALPNTGAHQPRGEVVRSGQVTMQKYFSAGILAHTKIPLSLGTGGPAVLNAFISQPKAEKPHKLFAIGLLIITVVIALLVIPVSRLVTRRLDTLRSDALQIASGDLDHRNQPKGKDEIAELGRAFNHMVSKMQEMVLSGQELTANLSHELRSPLARMRVTQEMMADSLQNGSTERLGDHLERIKEEIKRLDHLIGRMLELSKIDLHQKAMTREQVDLAAMARDLLRSFAAPAEARALELHSEIAPDLPTLSGDPQGLASVLSNIMDNAVRYTTEGGSITLSLFREESNLRLEILNTHQPLSPDDLAAMFEPFGRLEGVSATGYGLGLAIAKRVVERHGGSMDAANHDSGLCISVRLPR